MTRIAIMGAAGRMGQALVRATLGRDEIELIAAVDTPGSGRIGHDAGEVAGLKSIGILLGNDLAAALRLRPDVVIDFSNAVALPATLDQCVQARIALFVGTTGISAELDRRVADAGRQIAIIAAPNTSLGVTLLIELVRQAVASLPAEFDIEIGEAHHRLKKDAPSGTALALGAAAATARGRPLAELASWTRHGDAPRRAGEIGFAVMRGGDIVGEHRVVLAGDGEQLILEHRATDRGIFAHGAIAGAIWIARQHPGRYAMRDVLGFGWPADPVSH